MKRIKAQSAIEYLMIIALTLGIIVPTSYLFFRYSSESNIQIVDAQLTEIGRTIIDTAESVYFSGTGSKIVLEINMPKSVYDVEILGNKELVFRLFSEISATGESEVVFFSSIPIAESGDLTSIAGSGMKKIRIMAVPDQSGGTEAIIESVYRITT
mgnify:FL=1